MKMLTSGVVMPLGAEQVNMLPVPSVPISKEGMTFAKSFSEVAAEASESSAVVRATTEGTVPLSKSVETPAKGMDMFLKSGSGEAVKTTDTVAPETLTQSVEEAATEMQTALVQSVGGTASDAPTVVDTTATGEASSKSEETNASAAQAHFAASGKAIGPIEDSKSEVQSTGTKIDSMQNSVASKAIQLSMSDGTSSVMQKKEAVSAEKAGVVKTTKKDVKGKDHSATAAIDPEQTPGVAGAAAMQVSASVSMSGVVPVVATEVDRTVKAELGADGTGQMAGIAGAKVAKSNVWISEKDTSDERTTAIGSADDGGVAAKKNEADSSKLTTGSALVSKWVEERTHGSTEVGAAQVMQGVSGMDGDAGTPKVRAATTNVALTAGQDGVDSGAASVGDGHRTLEATPTALEVGVANGTHGWLKIRAEMTDGGVVNASVSATTSAGQEMLHRELPSLTSYLQLERIGVGSVVLHAATTGSRELSGGTESDAGRGQMQHGGGTQEESGQNATKFSDGGEVLFQGSVNGTADIATQVGYSGGSWLSVRA